MLSLLIIPSSPVMLFSQGLVYLIAFVGVGDTTHSTLILKGFIPTHSSKEDNSPLSHTVCTPVQWHLPPLLTCIFILFTGTIIKAHELWKMDEAEEHMCADN